MDATTFPLPLAYHIVLCVLGCVFFFGTIYSLKETLSADDGNCNAGISADTTVSRKAGHYSIRLVFWLRWICCWHW